LNWKDASTDQTFENKGLTEDQSAVTLIADQLTSTKAKKKRKKRFESPVAESQEKLTRFKQEIDEFDYEV